MTKLFTTAAIALSLLSTPVLGTENALDKVAEPPVAVLHEKSFKDSEQYLQSPQYAGITKGFVDFIYDTQNPDVLEVCAGQGQTLLKLLSDNRSGNHSIKYTAIELNPENMAILKTTYQDNKPKNGFKLGCAQKTVQDYFTSKPESKSNRFDAVFSGFGIHVFSAVDYLDSLLNIHTCLKSGGKLFLTQHSYSGVGYSADYQNELTRRNPTPFWTDGHFTSDVRSIINLMAIFGFKTESCELYSQVTLVDMSKTKFMGIIAVKSYEPDMNLINLYKSRVPKAI